MNKYISSAFAAAMVLIATSSLAQGADAATPGKGYGIIQQSGGGYIAPSASGRTTQAGLPAHSPTSHGYDTPVSQQIDRCDVRGYIQDRYVAIATVIPVGHAFRSGTDRTLRVTAPTKSSVMSRMREAIDDIGVPVRIVRYDIYMN